MKFNHLFYNSTVNFNSISKKKIVLSILLGLVAALLIYSFFYVFREAIRMLFLDFENRPLIIPETERQFYNLFFAAIAMILGNSMAISFLFSRPQNVFMRRHNIRAKIINDQMFLGPNFIHWFAKIWFLFGLFAAQFMDSAFITNFIAPSILLIVVLYLDSWKTFIRVIKKNRWKIQVAHLITFILLTFILSKIDSVDYKSYDKVMLASNPTINVPLSLYKKDNYNLNYYGNVVFKMKFSSNTNVDLLNLSNNKIEFYEIHNIIEDWKKEVFYSDYSKFLIKLRANKNILIRHIKEFELELFNDNHYKIIYEVANDDKTTSRFSNNQIKYTISPSLQEALPQKGRPPRVPGWDLYKEHRFKDTLSLHISDNIKIDGREIPLQTLSKKLKRHINKSTVIEYVYADSVTYQDYINVLSAHKIAVWELRATENYEAINEQYYKNQFTRDEELNKERWRIREKYPIHITERFE
ncbi:hypothetical protein OAA67_00785 [Winogradskyella sp.]|nr:hypothetical protein [Winogradskyella sp.]